MMTITSGVEHALTGNIELLAEASSIGFPVDPDRWPSQVDYEGVVFTRGNTTSIRGEVQYADYRQSEGVKLRVYND